MSVTNFDPPAGRTFIAGTDRMPPETVPFDEADFDSEAHRDAVLQPTPVVDAAGHVLPHWKPHQQIFGPQRSGQAPGAPGMPGAMLERIC